MPASIICMKHMGLQLNYGLRNIFYLINDTIRIAIRIVYRINVSTIRIVSYH